MKSRVTLIVTLVSLVLLALLFTYNCSKLADEANDEIERDMYVVSKVTGGISNSIEPEERVAALEAMEVRQGTVKALLRRAAPQNEEEGILHVGGLTIDVGNYEAFRNGEKLSLTLKEFELLKLLVLSRGKVLTRDFLLDRIWGYEFYGETRTVDVHIRHIRQKLGDDAHYIETIRGVGYKFNDRQDNRL